MDKTIEILLGSRKNIASIDVDTFDKIQLFTNESELTEYDVYDSLSSADVFDTERENSQTYRIYGRIEYMSLLNGLKQNYTDFEDFLLPDYSLTSGNITNSFDFYLVRPAESGYTEINGITNADGDDFYIRYFKVLATPSNFELIPAGFSNNAYNEKGYSFCINVDFNVSRYSDQFKFPLTELFLYAQYKKKVNGNSIAETVSRTTWSQSGKEIILSNQITNLKRGDYVKTLDNAKIGDLIAYDKENFEQLQISGQTFYITTKCNHPVNGSIDLVWEYNPFIPIRLRYFSSSLNSVNSGSTSYDEVNSIPEYATLIDGKGNYVWRDFVPQGILDPISEQGVNYPFINGRYYIFQSVLLPITPSLNNEVTKTVFNDIWFTQNVTKTNAIIKNNGDLGNIGKPCQ